MTSPDYDQWEWDRMAPVNPGCRGVFMSVIVLLLVFATVCALLLVIEARG